MQQLQTQIHPNTIRQLFYLALLIFLGIIILKELYFMMGAFLGAVTLYVILLYPMKILTVRYSWRPWLAALTLMVSSFVIMVIPVIYLVTVVIDMITPIIKEPTIISEELDRLHSFFLSQFGVNAFNPENVGKMTEQMLPFTQKTLGETTSALGNIFLMYLVLYFLLVQTRAVEIWLRKALPLKTDNTKKVLDEIRSLVYSNALGIPIVAFVQGVVATIGYSIFGVQEFILMGVLTAISSVIPIVGTMLIYLPLAIFQYSQDGAFSGIGVGLWGLIVIGSVDNIARLLVQKKLADIHPLITLLGVFMGISLFGFMGVIFGPLLLSIFIMLSRIYINEFGKFNADAPNEKIKFDEEL